MLKTGYPIIQVRAGFMKLFLENDRNGDGVLELTEFSAMIKEISSTAEDREISALYEEANAYEVRTCQ